IRFFFFDNSFDSAPMHWLDINCIGHIRVSHDGGRIGVDQNDAIAFFFKRLARLGTGIIKLTCLTNHNGSGADDQNAVDVSTFWHLYTLRWLRWLACVAKLKLIAIQRWPGALHM